MDIKSKLVLTGIVALYGCGAAGVTATLGARWWVSILAGIACAGLGLLQAMGEAE